MTWAVKLRSTFRQRTACLTCRKRVCFRNTSCRLTFPAPALQHSPIYDYVDTLSWTRGKHAFKFGGEVRYQNSNGWNSEYLIPYVNLGAGAFPVQGLDTGTVPGLVAQNQTVAQQILLDLAGSVGSIRQGFSISGSSDPVFLDYRDEKQKRRDYHQRDWTVFVKDDWKVRPDLTLNVGVRYEFFGVPWEARGLMAAYGRRQQWPLWNFLRFVNRCAVRRQELAESRPASAQR